MSRRRSALVLCLALAGSSLAGGSSHAEDRGRTPRFLAPYDAAMVQRVVEGARARLRQPDCHGLLDEFKDPEGVSLRERLEEKGLSVEEKLQQVRFVDASESTRCRSAQTWAFTARGWLIVYVCPRLLEKTLAREPALAEAVIIHELLHTLGLGENPPTSTAITARVEGLCRSR